MGTFLLGRLLSSTGMWVHNIAAAILVFELTSSATLVGAVSVAQFLPQLLLAPLSGARADRGSRRIQIIQGRLLAAAGSGGLAVILLTQELVGIGGASVVVAAALVAGIGFAWGGPALQAIVPLMVKRSELAAAVALNSVPFTVGRAAGPFLGASIAAVAGPAVAFCAAALGQIVFVWLLARMRLPAGQINGSDKPTMLGGLRYLRDDPPVAALLVGTAAVGIGADPVITLAPALADKLSQGPSFVGALTSAFGVGAAIVFLVLGWGRKLLGVSCLGTTGLVLMGLGLAVLAISEVGWSALIALAFAGAGMTFALTSLTTLIQERSPEDLRGRIMALWSLAFLGARPFAAALNGAMADMFSVTVALLLVVMFVLLGAWISRPARVSD